MSAQETVFTRNRCMAGREAPAVSVDENSHIPRTTSEGEPMLSVVVRVYNEREVLSEFHRRLSTVLSHICCSSEIIYVNVGSTDPSMLVIQELRAADGRVALTNLRRNFGRELAVTAGLDHARGEAAIVIDAGLQDPPEVIPQLIEKWREGHDMVYGRRRERYGETWLKRKTASAFYRVIHSIADTQIPEDTGDFRLLNRRCVEALSGCRERRPFLKGLFAWVVFQHTAITYDRDPRFAGKTKWNYWKLWNFAIRKYYLLYDRATEGRDIRRIDDGDFGPAICHIRRVTNTRVGRRGSGLRLIDGGHTTSGRSAADRHGSDRRVRGTNLYRDEGAATVLS